jgi:anti-sigma regulatory factor (Ser/Thr protein kinase)
VTSNQRCPILDASQPGEVRRAAAALASAHAFGETAAGRVALVVTEAATNLVKHAGGGEILLRVVLEGEEAFIEVLALDKGGGMRNVVECQRDGYSTSGVQARASGASGA